MAEITRSALAVKFQKGTQAKYNALTSKDPNTFYYITDSGAEQLYLGSTRLANGRDVTDALQRIATNAGDIETLSNKLNALTADGSGSVQDMIKSAIAEVNNTIGNLNDLTTDAKGTLVAAINEAEADAQAALDNSKVTLTTNGSPEDNSLSAIYTIKQGGQSVGTINIPKDLMVKSGKVVQNPSGQTAGTYIELTLNNSAEDKIYVNVGTLVDIYTAAASATQVQVAVNSSTREISATLVDGGVSTAKLAANAVTAAKVATGTLTATQMNSDINASLGLANSSVQDIKSGTANGTIKFKVGSQTTYTDVSVTGLGTAAYKTTDYFDNQISTAKSDLNTSIANVDAKATQNATDISSLTGVVSENKTTAATAAANAQSNAVAAAKAYTEEYAATKAQGALADTALQAANIVTGSANGTIAVKGTDVKVKGLGSAAYTDTTAYDAAGAANTALTTAKKYSDDNLTSAKSYTDTLFNEYLVWGEIA
jgi:hypothetical protein